MGESCGRPRDMGSGSARTGPDRLAELRRDGSVYARRRFVAKLLPAAADVCMWDILGKAVNRPIYKILSGGAPTKERMMAYASSQHLPTVEDYVPDVLKAKELGYKAYKIHPGQGQHATGPKQATSDTWRKFVKFARRLVTNLF